MTNWRQDLLTINFFRPLEEAAELFFRHKLKDQSIRVVIKHKLDMSNGNLVLSILIMIGNDFRLHESSATFPEQQISGMLEKTRGLDLRSLIGMYMFNSTMQKASIIEDIADDLFSKYHAEYKKSRNINQPKSETDATMDGQVQA